MKHGDISNDLPKRVIVTLDTFLNVAVEVKKKFKILPVATKSTTLNRAMLSRMYLFSQRAGYTMELASFTLNEDALQKVIDNLDHVGTNPFRYFTVYESVDHLVQELPYRPEVVGVLDVPSRALRYGHWGLDFSQL